MKKKIYTDEQLTQLVERQSKCKFIETYKKKMTHSAVRMLKLKCDCGRVFDVAWNKFNRKDGKPQHQCRECGIALRGKNQRITDAEYTSRKKELGISIKHLEEPRGRMVGIRHICPKCLSDDWFPQPANILCGASTMCKKCSGEHRKLDNVWYQSEKERLGINIKNVQPYVGADLPIWHICPKCEGGWLVRPHGVLSGNSTMCIPCSYSIRNRYKILSDKEVSETLILNNLVWVYGEYKCNSSVLGVRCGCGGIFEKKYEDIRSGWNRCTSCTKSISSGEHHIKEWLDNRNYEYVYQQKFDDLRGKRKMPLSYDFGIYQNGELIALVEYDGAHHFKPIYSLYETKEEAERVFYAQLKRDRRKDDYATSSGLYLIRLKGKDYENLDAKLGDILNNMLIPR